MAVPKGSFYMARLAAQQRKAPPVVRRPAPVARPVAGPAYAPPAATQADFGGGMDFGGGGGGGGGGYPGGVPQEVLASMLGAQGAAERAGTRGAIQQALIGFGLVPQNFKDELGALDDTTRALIQKNTDTGISGYARLLQAAQDEQRAAMNQIASQGLRRSGARGYKLRRLQLKKDQTQQDAIAALLAEVGGRYQGYAQNEGQRQLQLLQNLYQSSYNPGGGYVTQGWGGSGQQGVGPGGGGGGTPTIGGGQWMGGYGTAYGPAGVGQGGGFTSPLHPLLMG